MENYAEVINENLGSMGRMLSGSKIAPKGQICVWNGNIIVDGKKVWFGDINLTKDEKKLKNIANLFNKSLYILREMDCRFDTESNPLIKNAIAVINPDIKGE